MINKILPIIGILAIGLFIFTFAFCWYIMNIDNPHKYENLMFNLAMLDFAVVGTGLILSLINPDRYKNSIP